MPQFLLIWLAIAISLMITAYFVPNFVVLSLSSAMIGAAVSSIRISPYDYQTFENTF